MKPWQWFSWEGGQTFWPHASGGGRLSSEASPVCRQRCTDWKIKTTVALFFSSQIFYSSHSPKIVMQKHPMGHLAEQTLQRLGQNAYTTNSLSSFAVSVQRKEKKNETLLVYEMEVMMMERQRWGESSSCCFGQMRRRKGGYWCRPSPAMQCWAASPNHLPAVSEGGWARGWRQPRRVLGQTEWESVCVIEKVGERESASVQRVLQDSASSRASTVLSFPPCTLLLVIIFSLLLFATRTLYNLCFSVISTLSYSSTLLFTLHPSRFHSFGLLITFFFCPGGWSES